MTKILVYGTLKKGYALNNYLKSCKFVGIGTIEGYKMYCNGYYPMIIKTDNKSKTITGEIYEVTDEDVLRDLDMVEGAYDRTKEIATLENGEQINIEVYVYAYQIHEENRIPTGVWAK